MRADIEMRKLYFKLLDTMKGDIFATPILRVPGWEVIDYWEAGGLITVQYTMSDRFHAAVVFGPTGATASAFAAGGDATAQVEVTRGDIAAAVWEAFASLVRRDWPAVRETAGE